MLPEFERIPLSAEEISKIEKWSEATPSPERLGSISAEFLESCFTSPLVEERIERAISVARKGEEDGFFALRAEHDETGFELVDLLRRYSPELDYYYCQVPLLSLISGMKEGNFKIFELHTHYRKAERLIVSGAHMVWTRFAEGDLVASSYSREYHRMFLGYDVFPVNIVGAPYPEEGKAKFIFYQEVYPVPVPDWALIEISTALKTFVPEFSWYLYEYEDEETIAAYSPEGFVKKMSSLRDRSGRPFYKAEIIEWENGFSAENLERIKRFAFTPKKISDEERFTDRRETKNTSFFLRVYLEPESIPRSELLGFIRGKGFVYEESENERGDSSELE